MKQILLVGLGGMGKVHYVNYQHLDGMAHVVAAVGSGDADRKTAASFSLPFFTSITEAVRHHGEIDVVDITTPSFLHVAGCLEALQWGRDVICEKPLALCRQDAQRIFDASHRAGRLVLPAHVLRYTHEYAVLHGLVASGRYGRVLGASFTRLSTVPAWARGGWLLDPKKSGGVSFDLHIHDLDMIVGLFGKPGKVESRMETGDARVGDTYLTVSYGYKDIDVRAEAGWINAPIPFTATWRVVFAKALAVNDGKAVRVYPADGAAYEPDISYPVTVSTGINVPPTGWYYEELKRLLMILEGRSEPLVRTEEVLAELGILETL